MTVDEKGQFHNVELQQLNKINKSFAKEKRQKRIDCFLDLSKANSTFSPGATTATTTGTSHSRSLLGHGECVARTHEGLRVQLVAAGRSQPTQPQRRTYSVPQRVGLGRRERRRRSRRCSSSSCNSRISIHKSGGATAGRRVARDARGRAPGRQREGRFGHKPTRGLQTLGGSRARQDGPEIKCPGPAHQHGVRSGGGGTAAAADADAVVVVVVVGAAVLGVAGPRRQGQ